MDRPPLTPQQQQQLPGLLLLLAFLFFINASSGPITASVDGHLAHPDGAPSLDNSTVDTLPPLRPAIDELEAYLAGNASAWSPADPSSATLLAALTPPPPALPPPTHHHQAPHYAPNITGFIRHERSISFNLSDPWSWVATLPEIGSASSSDSLAAAAAAAYLATLDRSNPVFHPPVDSSNASSAAWPFLTHSSDDDDITTTTTTDPDAHALQRNETLAKEHRGSFPYLLKSSLPITSSAAAGNETTGSFVSDLGWRGWRGRHHAVGLTIRESGWWEGLHRAAGGGGGRGEERFEREGWTHVKGSVELSLLADDDDEDEGNDGGGSGQTWVLEGVHHQSNGTLYLLGSTEDRPDLRDLPGFFLPGTKAHGEVLGLVRGELRREEEETRRGDATTTTTTTTDDLSVLPPRTTCPLKLVLQLAPLDPSVSLSDLARSEAELQNPTGLPLSPPRARIASGVWWSWECGVGGWVEGKGEVLRAEAFWRGSVNYAFEALLAQGLILFLLVWQMERSRAPAQLAKVAVGTVSMQCALDGAVFIGHVMVGIIVGRRTLALMGTAFLALLSCAMFGPRWLVTIKIAQEGERRPATARPPPAAPAVVGVTGRPAPEGASGRVGRNSVGPPPRRGETVGRSPLAPPPPPPPPPPLARAQAASLVTPPIAPPPSGTAPAAADAVAGAGLPAPATTADAAQVMPGALPRFPVLVAPPPQEAPSPLVMALLFFLLLLQTNLIPLLFPFLLFALHAFWLPQIVRNASRGTRRALSWRYLVGTTVGRLWYATYFASGWWEDNVLFLERSNWFIAIVLLQLAQLLILALQDLYSPTFFLPGRFAPPPAYDYHPALPSFVHDGDDVEKAGGGIVGWAEEDCAICMEPLVDGAATAAAAAAARDGSDVVAGAFKGHAASAGFNRTEWALAPCHHVFHTACLEPWMAIRSVCPQCRGPLPPMS